MRVFSFAAGFHLPYPASSKPSPAFPFCFSFGLLHGLTTLAWRWLSLRIHNHHPSSEGEDDDIPDLDSTLKDITSFYRIDLIGYSLSSGQHCLCSSDEIPYSGCYVAGGPSKLRQSNRSMHNHALLMMELLEHRTRLKI